jgi:hypothetical protein
MMAAPTSKTARRQMSVGDNNNQSRNDDDTTTDPLGVAPYERKILAIATNQKTYQDDGNEVALMIVVVTTVTLIVLALVSGAPNASERVIVPVALLLISWRNYLHQRFKRAALSVIQKLQGDVVEMKRP